MNRKELHNYLQMVDGEIHFQIEGRLFLLTVASAVNMLIALFGVLLRLTPRALDGLYCLHCGDPMSEHSAGECEPLEIARQ